MSALRDYMRMTIEDWDRRLAGKGGITSNDSQALAALHNFLRFQITEHRAGDLLEGGQGPEASAAATH